MDSSAKVLAAEPAVLPSILEAAAMHSASDAVAMVAAAEAVASDHILGRPPNLQNKSQLCIHHRFAVWYCYGFHLPTCHILACRLGS
jgi:hypothetical protein